MDLQAVRALALSTAHATQGVAATVTVPGGAAVATRIIWLQHQDESMPVGRDFQRREPRRTMQVTLSDALPDVPRGTEIVAVPRGGTVARTWRVENIDHVEADWQRVIVAPVD